jgi:predicted amidohydrolase YtcJ
MQDEAVVYVAERVRTLDPAQPLAEALAVRGGKVEAVGTRAQVLERVGAGARVVELAGATVVPGLVDAHAHLSGLGRALNTLSLVGAKTKAEALERIRSAPRSSLQGDWLVGRGWDQNDWTDAGGAFPDRRALDALYPNNPVALARIDGHAAWVNSEALRRAGITAKTADPPGGRILRDAAGEPTGS